MINFVRFALLFFTLWGIQSSSAQVMSSFVREQTGTLPRGRFLVSMVSVRSSLDRMFNRQGKNETLSANFNQEIRFQKIMDDEPTRGSQLGGLFLSNGINLNDSAGNVSGSALGIIDGKVPLLGYGIRDDLGVYFAIPVIEFKMTSGYRFNRSTSTRAFLDQLRINDQASIASEFEAALDSSLENKLYRANYDWNADLNRTYLGDLQINLVQTLANAPEFKSQVQPILIVPTSTNPDLRDLYSLKAGEHRWGLGLKYSAQKLLIGSLQLNAGFSTTYLFPAEQARRLPKDESDPLNEWIDANTQVSGGLSYRSQLQFRYPFPKWVGLNLGVDWQQRFQDSFRGSAVSARSYEIAGSRTGASLLTSYASMDLNSIQSFLAGDFLFPAQAELGVGLPLAGTNAIAEPVIQLQGTLFF